MFIGAFCSSKDEFDYIRFYFHGIDKYFNNENLIQRDEQLQIDSDVVTDLTYDENNCLKKSKIMVLITNAFLSLFFILQRFLSLLDEFISLSN